MRERARREVQMAEVEDERTKHKIEEKHVNQESIIKVSNSYLSISSLFCINIYLSSFIISYGESIFIQSFHRRTVFQIPFFVKLLYLHLVARFINSYFLKLQTFEQEMKLEVIES